MGPRRATYLDGDDKVKAVVAKELEEWVKTQGGRFFNKHASSCCWYEQSDKAVRTSLRSFDQNMYMNY